MVRLYSLDPSTTSCSHNGRSYRRGPDGSFDVDESAVASLCKSAGFTTIAPAATKAPAVSSPAIAPVTVATPAAALVRDDAGRFVRGVSGNPSGLPKWVTEGRARAGASVVRAVD